MIYYLRVLNGLIKSIATLTENNMIQFKIHSKAVCTRCWERLHEEAMRLLENEFDTSSYSDVHPMLRKDFQSKRHELLQERIGKATNKPCAVIHDPDMSVDIEHIMCIDCYKDLVDELNKTIPEHATAG